MTDLALNNDIEVLVVTELGQKLKEAREAKGMTLNQLQEITKIQKRYLAAIEEGKYNVLPGEFYVKAFIKQYAEAVGISKDELATLQGTVQPQAPEQEVKLEKETKKEMKKEVKKPKEEKEEKPVAMSRQKRTDAPSPISTSRISEFLPRILVIVAIFAVLLAGWFIAQQFTSNDARTAPQQGETTDNVEGNQPEDSPLNSDNATDEGEDTADEDDTTDEIEPEEETAAQTLTVTETSGNRSTMTLENADTFVITLTAAEAGESYVQVSNNENQVFFSGVLQRGQTETIDVSTEDVIELNIGRTLDLTVEINGEEMTYPIATNERVHQRITIERVSDTE